VTCPEGASKPASTVEPGMGTAEASRENYSSLGGFPSAKEQIRLIQLNRLNQKGFAHNRRISRGGHFGIASVSELRLAHERLAEMPEKSVTVNNAGGRTASISLALQERSSARYEFGHFVERHAWDKSASAKHHPCLGRRRKRPGSAVGLPPAKS